MKSVTVGLLTTPDALTAESIVSALVGERLIACGNIAGALDSIYRWQGAVERAGEVLVIMKTTTELVERVAARVLELHPYDVPEIIFLPVGHGSESYLQWVRESVVSDQEVTG